MRVSIALFLAITLLMATAGLASADRYAIDPAHSQVLFKVKHLGISTVSGKFTSFAGSFSYSPEDVASSSASVTIEAASITTGVEKRDAHLKSDDFFDVEKIPQLLFASTAIRNVDGDRFELVGDLTMHGITKEVVLDVVLDGTAVDPWGNDRVAFSATTQVNRKDFELNWNQVLESGGLLVSNEVEIALEISAIKEKIAD